MVSEGAREKFPWRWTLESAVFLLLVRFGRRSGGEGGMRIGLELCEYVENDAD